MEPGGAHAVVPPYKRLILDAIARLARPDGSSGIAIARDIKGWLVASGRVVPARFATSLRTALDRLVNKGTLVRANNSFKIRPKNQRPTAFKRLGARMGYQAGFRGLRRPGWRGVVNVPRMRPYEQIIADAITILARPNGSSRRSITNLLEAPQIKVARGLDNLVKKGMATRIRNTFQLRPENKRPHVLAQFLKGRDRGYAAGRWFAEQED